jgi:hypothetical protein
MKQKDDIDCEETAFCKGGFFIPVGFTFSDQ